MKPNIKKAILIAGALAASLLLGWLIFGRSGDRTPDGHMHGEEAAGETIWTCSMHPQIRRNEPGDCPICGMDLIPLEEDGKNGADPMAVSMSPAAMQLADVETAIAGTMTPVKTIRLNGKVQADERRVYSQSSHIPGRVEKLAVNFTGEYITRGQVIASVYSPDLVAAQEELFEANKIKDTQPELFEASKEKLKNWKFSDERIERMLEEGTSTDVFDIHADISGYVTEKKVNPGDYVRRGQAIYEIADLSTVWVLFDVYESDLAWIKKGDRITFTIASLPGETFKGTVSYIDPVLDPRTRVAKARVEAVNSGGKLKPEMFASGTVEATLPGKSSRLVVPKTAVMWTGKRSVVYVKSSSEKGVNFVMREVTLGPALGESFVVEKGLRKGEEIAVHGTFSIDAAAQLAGKPSMMNQSGGPAMTGHDHGGARDAAPAMELPRPTPKAAAISREARRALEPLYSGYLDFKNALAADDLAAAQEAAGKMRADLAKINMSVFTGESHSAWMKYSGALAGALRHVPHYKTIEEARKAFQEASGAMIGLTRAFKPYDKPLYLQYCPMADGNKGADWLSLEKEIKNPYFGAAMLKCGETKDTIK